MDNFLRNQLAWVVFAVLVAIGAVFAVLYRQRLLTYLDEVRQEWTRVTTPTREEAVAHTAIVIVGVLIAAVFMYIVDLVLGPLMELFYRF
jgi:preprotein translocase SecE subunit